MSHETWAGFPLRDACIYELHVGTFTPRGTYAGVAAKLDHLVELGINAIELMPVHRFAGSRGWGYDVVDLRSTHDGYGSPAELRNLIEAAHERGIAVIADVVHNHVAPSADVTRDFGPHHTTARHATPWGSAINLDGEHSEEVRAFILDNVQMWIEDLGFDGLRLDATDALVDESAVHILEAIGTRVREIEARLGRIVWVIAESDLNDPKVVRERAAGGYGMDAQWSDDFHHALHALLTGERVGYYASFGAVAHVAAAVERAFVFDGRPSHHDRHGPGRATEGLSGHRFLGYLQNHDQVGNRPRGDRSGELMSPGMVQIGAALVLTSPFVPLLFMGEEWGASTPFLFFTDHSDPDLGRTVSHRRRRELAEFGWTADDVPDPQDPATFEASRLRWDELADPRHADLLDWHRSLTRMRRELPDLADGRLDLVRTRHSEDPPWLVIERGVVTIAYNFIDVEVEAPVPSAGHELLLTSAKDPEPRGDYLRLPPESVSILSR